MNNLHINSLNRATKLSGLFYILIIMLGIIKVSFIEPIIIADDVDGTINNINDHLLLFRTGIVIELLMYVLVIVLSVFLYRIVKSEGKYIAITALLFRFGEAVVGSISIILSGMIPLKLLENNIDLDRNQFNVLIQTFLNTRITSLNIVLIFVGIGGTIYCYLFLRSLFIPRLLSLWGIITYISMVMLGLINILFPDRPNLIEMVLFGLGSVFEIILGLWLLIKGIKYAYPERK